MYDFLVGVFLPVCVFVCGEAFWVCSMNDESHWRERERGRERHTNKTSGDIFLEGEMMIDQH